MRKLLSPTILLLALFIISIFLQINWRSFLFSFSPQAAVDPLAVNGDYYPEEELAIVDNQEFFIPEFLAYDITQEPVLGQTSLDKRIDVDLTNQRLYAFEGDRMVFNFLISTGKWGRTPTGEFYIWTKLRYTKMEGGSRALRTYYYLPNVPYVMYFYNNSIPKSRGYGLHGTYWHNNFGQPMSHGCVNLRTEDAAQLYYWAQPDLRGKKSIMTTGDNVGTRIVIYGQAPPT